MTREEQITYKAGCIADGCIAHGAPWKEYHQGFIEGAKWADANPSQPSLPSNLDEAAEEYAFISEGIDARGKKYKDYDTGKLEGFKAGAEWIAGQGVTFETEVYESYTGKPFIEEITESFIPGDEVVVQIRKK